MEGKFFIVGLMGSGKSHWGKIWAEKNGLKFYDLDQWIEEGVGKSISRIFNEEGESYFRKLESEALRAFADKSDFIVSCGGGSPCFDDNMDWMNAHGTTVYLKVPPAILVQRLMDDKSERPLIKDKDPGELIVFVENKLKEREPFYKKAKFIVDEEKLSVETLSRL